MMHKNRKKPVYLFSTSPTDRGEELRRRTKRANQRTVTFFMVFLYLFTLISLIIPLRPTYSDLEQRNLTKFPTPTLATISNGAFFEGVNTWFADTFPFREQFLKLETGVTGLYGVKTSQVVGDVKQGDDIPDAPMTPDDSDSSADASGDASSSGGTSSSGDASASTPADSNQTKPKDDDSDATIPELDKNAKSETLGAVLVIDDAAYEYFNFDQKAANSYIKMMNKTAKKLKGKANLYDLIVPTSMDVCVPDSVRKGLNTSSQEKAIEYIFGSMGDGVHSIKVLDTLIKHNADGEYVYFRTDHHWTALGAYHAYERFCEASGQTAASLDSFKKVTYKNFHGSFYRDTKSNALKNHPDKIVAYIPPSTNSIAITNMDGSKMDWNIITDVSTWNSTAKYSTFIGGDNPFSVVKNPNVKNGKSVMLIKESFGNAFAPFLVENYENVYIVDYRYIKNVDQRSLTQMVDKYKIDDVLFVNNVSAVRNESAVKLMSNFVG